MSERAPIRFQCDAEDGEQLTAPTTAREERRRAEALDPTIASAARRDPRVSDLACHGWCLHPPGSATLDPDADERVTPTEAREFVTIDDALSTPERVAAVVDTRWRVAVDEGTPVLVAPWSGTLEGGVVPQLVTADDGSTPLRVPIVTEDVVTLDPDRPIAQVVPLPNALVDESFECGVLGEGRTQAVERIRAMSRTHDPYPARYRVEKEATPLSGQERVERSRNDRREP